MAGSPCGDAAPRLGPAPAAGPKPGGPPPWAELLWPKLPSRGPQGTLPAAGWTLPCQPLASPRQALGGHMSLPGPGPSPGPSHVPRCRSRAALAGTRPPRPSTAAAASMPEPSLGPCGEQATPWHPGSPGRPVASGRPGIPGSPGPFPGPLCRAQGPTPAFTGHPDTPEIWLRHGHRTFPGLPGSLVGRGQGGPLGTLSEEGPRPSST